jgi:hypothetical protein
VNKNSGILWLLLVDIISVRGVQFRSSKKGANVDYVAQKWMGILIVQIKLSGG